MLIMFLYITITVMSVGLLSDLAIAMLSTFIKMDEKLWSGILTVAVLLGMLFGPIPMIDIWLMFKLLVVLVLISIFVPMPKSEKEVV